MNTMNHTAEEVRVMADNPALLERERNALHAYADMIERAEKGVTDDVIDVAWSAAISVQHSKESGFPMARRRLRAALLSVWPVAAERIKADESAEPAAWRLRRTIGCVTTEQYWKDEPTEGIKNSWVVDPLFTHPPAQAAKVDAWQIVCDSIRTHQFIGPRSRLTIDVERLLNEINERRKAAEPVAQDEVVSLPALWRQRDDNDEQETEFDKGYEQASDECADALEAALAAQPRAVPDAMAERTDMDGYSNGYVTGWNACRAAILAAAPQPGEP